MSTLLNDTYLCVKLITLHTYCVVDCMSCINTGCKELKNLWDFPVDASVRELEINDYILESFFQDLILLVFLKSLQKISTAEMEKRLHASL